MNSLFASVVLAALSMVVISAPAHAAPLSLYVAADGRDTWSGRKAAPNAARTDGPFATLERARDAIRKLRAAGKAPKGGVTVWIGAGTYARESTFTLEAKDGGTADSPVVYRAKPGATVRIVGGREANGWKPVADPAVLARIDEGARAHVVVADLKAQGITEYGQLRRRGFGQSIWPAGLELFFADKPMALARWPNESWATIKGAPNGPEGGRFAYEGDRPARWTKAEDLWLHGYWTFDWADTYEKVASIDPEKREIATVPPHGIYGYAPGRRFYALNLLEELDSPGEWWLDRATGLLYFWPPSPVEAGHAVVSMTEQPLITLRDAKHVTFRGLTIECGRDMGLTMLGCEDCLVAGCTIRNMGTGGVYIDGGARCGVQSCEVYEVGDGGIGLNGGDRQTLTPAGHFVDNCHIHHQSRWDATYRPAIGINGVGNRATHNVIHDGPHNAILMGGNDHLIEFNDISRECTETGDAGAVYMGRDLAMRGTIIRYNRFHDIGATVKGNQEGRYTEVMAVYLDDCYCGTTVFGNLFINAGRSIMLGGGRDNTIENNVFVDCNPSIHIDGRGKGWASKYFVPKGEWSIFENLKAVPYDRPPYSTRYPHLANIMEDDPAAAKYDRVLRNVHLGKGKWIDWLDGLSEKTVECTGNWTAGDPGFVAAAKGDFGLKKDAPVLKQGFQPIPFGKIGLYSDEYRRLKPQTHADGRR